jgi:hypothetical protein
MTRSFFSLMIVGFLGAPSLTRGRVCNLLYNCFWALPEQSLLGRSPAELTAISYCLIWDSPNLEGRVPVFKSPRKRVAQIYPRALGSLSVASYDSQGYGGGILSRLHSTRDSFSMQSIPCFLKGKTKLHGLSPWAYYTARATAACRRSDCQLLRIKFAMWSAWRIPTAVFSVF